MKKLFLMGFVALAFASCVSDKEVTPQTQEQKYEAAFEATFGKVAESVNWGFTDQSYFFNNEGKVQMRGVNANGNGWGLYVTVPEPLTDAQKQVVTEWFQSHENPEGVAVNWSDFFVQQVYKGEWGSNMNYLYCGSDTDHTYNFNAGDAGVYGDVCYGLSDPNDINARIYGSDKIEFMVDSSTEYFGFHNSFDSNFYKDNYVIIPGDIIDSSVAGMWFVGFDFEANGQAANQQVARDYYFDNWIVKITPGLYKGGQRVFVEDLISSDLDKIGYNAANGESDWDFNDAVFDVFINYNEYWHNDDCAVITLWAAGGTKALTIDGEEVHEKLGVNTKTMVNTGDGATAAPVIFRLKNKPTSANANDIEVKVGGYTLTATQGAATQKLCAPTTVDWAGEREAIWKVYPKFKDYVAGKVDTWY